MKIGFRQSEKFSESARVANDPQNFARRTMTFQTSLAPIATPAGEVDLANNAIADQTRVIGPHDFSDKFVTRSARESVITTKKLEIRVADASYQEANQRVAFGPSRLSCLSYRRSACFKVNRNHSG
jgi:hypothetical protein